MKNLPPCEKRCFRLKAVSGWHIPAARHGYTLMEMLISVSVLSMFFLFAYQMFERSSESFNTGSWRISKQKELQTLLTALKELLEKANYMEMMTPGGITVTEKPTPINVRAQWYWLNDSCAAPNKGAMFFAVSEPCLAADATLGRPTQTNGKWSVVSLHSDKGKLTLQRTGSQAVYNAMVDTQGSDNNTITGNFVPWTGINTLLSVTDVASMRIAFSLATETFDVATSSTLTISLTAVRYKNNKPTPAMVIEKVTAKLLKNSQNFVTLF